MPAKPERAMSKPLWRKAIKITLCGSIAGFILFLLTAFTLQWFASDTLALLHTAAQFPKADGLVFLLIDMAMGMLMMWLAERLSMTQSPSSFKLSLQLTLVWAGLKTLQSAHWVALGFFPTSHLFVPLILSCLSVYVAATIGVALLVRVK